MGPDTPTLQMNPKHRTVCLQAVPPSFPAATLPASMPAPTLTATPVPAPAPAPAPTPPVIQEADLLEDLLGGLGRPEPAARPEPEAPTQVASVGASPAADAATASPQEAPLL